MSAFVFVNGLLLDKQHIRTTQVQNEARPLAKSKYAVHICRTEVGKNYTCRTALPGSRFHYLFNGDLHTC